MPPSRSHSAATRCPQGSPVQFSGTSTGGGVLVPQYRRYQRRPSHGTGGNTLEQQGGNELGLWLESQHGDDTHVLPPHRQPRPPLSHHVSRLSRRALWRGDIDLDARTVRIRAALVQRESGKLEIGPPKSRASLRTVTVPQVLIPVLRNHLDTFVKPEPGAFAFAFVGAKGKLLRRNGFPTASGWADAVAAIGKPGLHFHDLRHTGNTWAARAVRAWPTSRPGWDMTARGRRDVSAR